MKMGRKTLMAAAALLVATATLFTGCSAGRAVATADMITLVVGNGRYDAKIEKIVYPGNPAEGYDSNAKTLYYLPGNTRNYVVGKPGEKGIDRDTPATGRTKQGTPVNVWLNSSWQLNQTYSVLETKTWPFCLKYNCFATDPTQRNENSGISAGWTKMLDETFSKIYDSSVREVMPQFDDTTWKDQKDWDALAKAISVAFTKNMRAKTGFSEDLFCGSGDISTWGTTTPGKDGRFDCGPITFEVTGVEAQNNQQQQANADANAAQEQQKANADILAAAVAKYGSKETAGQVLGQMDVIQKCRDAQMTTCVITIGTSTVSVSIPAAK